MTAEREPSRTIDPDGVLRTLRPRARVGRSVFLAGLALAGLFVGLALIDPTDRARDPGEAGPGDAFVPVAGDVLAGGDGRSPDSYRPPVRITAAPVEELSVQMETPPELPPGAKSGIQLFPPPGTKPIKRGLVVPEDFELPPGYVRHYQTLDDGTMLPAVLTFHPDYQPVDAEGRPIPVGEDRLVPETLAPPGLPLKRLVVPGEEPKDAPQ